MFHFFKRKVNEQIDDCDDKTKEDEDSITIGSGLAVTDSMKKIIENTAVEYAKPESYTGNRDLYDSGVAKKNAKTKLFKNGKDVIDPYTEKKILLTKKEAKRLHGDDWQSHLAESDHIKPLERIYTETKNKVWLTTDNIKDAANSSDNIVVTSRKVNNSKRSRTNKEYVENKTYLEEKGINLSRTGKEAAIRDGQNANKSINHQLRKDTINNIMKTGHGAGKIGATNSGITTATMSGIMNIVDVIEGKKDADEAIVDTVVSSGKAAVSGYIMGGGLTVASHSLSNSSSKFIQALTKSNVPGNVITAVMLTGDTLKEYGNGEISTQECLIRLGEKGINFATTGYSMGVGQALIPIPIVGAAIGAFVGSLLTSNYSNQLIHELKTKELEHQERERIIRECEVATQQAIRFREELEIYLENYFSDYKDCFNEAVCEIKHSMLLGDSEGVVSGANKVTKKLGAKVQYETFEEFEDFMNSNELFTL